MKVLKVEPGKKPEVKEIENELEVLQKEVEGSIEEVYPFDDVVAIICNEEGKINGMELNRCLKNSDGEIMDIVAGPFLIVGLTEDDFGSLSDQNLEKYSKRFELPELFFRTNETIQCIVYESKENNGPAMSM